MNINKAQKVLLNTVKAQKDGKFKGATMLWGPPGVGKSSIVRQVADELGLPLIDVRLSTLSVVDVRGLPFIDKEKGVTHFAKPFFVPDEPALLFFDEINTAPPANQVVAYEIALDRRVGGHVLPEGTIVVMAGNRMEDRGATHAMPVPLRNRMMHITIEPDVDSTYEYGLQHGWDSTILAFLKWRPDYLYQPPKGNQEAFPSPRSWEYVNAILAYDDSYEAISGLIGEVAAEFLAYRRLVGRLPDLDAILAGKAPAYKDDDLSVMYAYVTGLVGRVRNQKPTQTLAKNFVKALETVPTELLPVAVLGVSNAPINTVLIGLPEWRKALSSIGNAVR